MKINPNMLYCPKCKGEYMPRVSSCAVCMVPLVKGADLFDAGYESRKANRDGREISKGENIVPVHRAPLNEIKQFQSVLARENIASMITGEGNSCNSCKGGGCSTSFYLQVRRVDAADAVRIIEEELIRTSRVDHEHEVIDTVFDPTAGEALCPACGTNFSTKTSTCPDCGLCFA